MFAAAALLSLAFADAPTEIPVWPGKAPFAVGDTATDKPTVTVYRAPVESANGAAVVVVPGGGYGGLANDHEGKQIAAFLNSKGVTAFVLKYRVANRERPGPLLLAPLTDAQRAIRFVRAQAKEYGIDPKRVGIWGFSAGGHLASSAATHFDAGKKDGDEIDQQSCRPDFAILCYPVISMEDGVTHGGSKMNLLGKNPDPKLVENFSNEKQVTKETPPTFIFHTSADTVVLPENAIRFYTALKKAGVPAELHIYEKGVHGVGLGRNEPSLAGWPDRLTDWLKSRKILDKP
jgi:acetyl esterase/lipase